MTKGAAKDQIEFGDGVPGWDEEVRTRLTALFEAVGGLADAGRISGISVDALANWRDGRARPAFYPLARLCKAAGRSLDWLATGEGPPRPVSDAGQKAAVPSPSRLLFGSVDTSRLDRAFREALTQSGIPAEDIGDTNALMLLTILLHDAAVKAAESTRHPTDGNDVAKAGAN